MTPAPLGRRAAAWVIDLVITVPAPLAPYLIVAVVVFADDVPLGVGLPLVAALVLFHLLYAPLLLRRTGPHAGQTVGKQAIGLSVRRSDGDVVGFGRALGRELLARSLLGIVPLYTLVDLHSPLSNDPRRAIHDIIADTLVVRQ